MRPLPERSRVSRRKTVAVRLLDREALSDQSDRLEQYVARSGQVPLSYHPAWLSVFADGLGHVPYCLEAVQGEETRGLLPLAFVQSILFGKYLAGLPYLNMGEARADDPGIARELIDASVRLADQLAVKHLELRHERAIDHPKLETRAGRKVHMRLSLPGSAEELWGRFRPEVRNQVRKGEKHDLALAWGGEELLPDFYEVFSINMRDLGTPVFSRRLFRSILRRFPDRAELCVVRHGERPVAAALLVHGWGVTEVPSASSLRQFNATSANMLMYWRLLERAIERGQAIFDFGRSSPDSGTFRFKKQWGAAPELAEWQYYVRQGAASDLRPENPKYQRMIRMWQRLPVGLTRFIGPIVVRGIP